MDKKKEIYFIILSRRECRLVFKFFGHFKNSVISKTTMKEPF